MLSASYGRPEERRRRALHERIGKRREGRVVRSARFGPQPQCRRARLRPPAVADRCSAPQNIGTIGRDFRIFQEQEQPLRETFACWGQLFLRSEKGVCSGKPLPTREKTRFLFACLPSTGGLSQQAGLRRPEGHSSTHRQHDPISARIRIRPGAAHAAGVQAPRRTASLAQGRHSPGSPSKDGRNVFYHSAPEPSSASMSASAFFFSSGVHFTRVRARVGQVATQGGCEVSMS